MSAVEFVKNRESREPATGEVVEVLVLSAGVWDNCIRFLAPLVITDEQLREALEVLEGCVVEVASRKTSITDASGDSA